MKPRRHFLTSIAAGALMLVAGSALAAPPTVEIVAMAHPPVVIALKPLRDWIARQGKKLRVIELDGETPTGAKRLQSAGLTGHVPILILIDGKHAFLRKDGSRVEFAVTADVRADAAGLRLNTASADASVSEQPTTAPAASMVKVVTTISTISR